MDYKFKHGDKVRVVRLNSQCTAQNSSRIKVGDVFTIEGPLDRSFVGSNERIYSVQEKTLIFWEDELELVDGVQDNKEAANVEMVHLDFMIPKNNKAEAIRIAKDAVKKVYSWTQEDKGKFFQCANPDGDNPTAICVYLNDYLTTLNYTRDITKGHSSADIFSLAEFILGTSFPKTVQQICSWVGLDYYHDFESDLPESFKITKELMALQNDDISYVKELTMVKPIPAVILNYYTKAANPLFFADNISYQTQKEFELGYDPQTNHITIPIRDELGTLVGVEAESLVSLTSMCGVYISTGSACNSHAVEPSYVLKAIGLSDEKALCSVRISFGPQNLPSDINYAIKSLTTAVKILKKENVP